MSTKTRAFVEEFHTTYRATVSTEPTLNTGYEELRVDLIVEEILETLGSIMLGDETEFVDGLGDLDYVLEGAAITFGIDLEDYKYSLEEYAERDSAELLGMLVLTTAELNAFLTGYDHLLDSLRISIVKNKLESLKAIVWTIASPNLSDIPLEEIIEVIHESNMSKLGEDGKPIFREDGKVLKGPNFFTPTEKIKAIMEKHNNDRQEEFIAKLS